MSTGTADTYSSAVTVVPSRIARPATVPSSFVTISLTGAEVRISPPRALTCSAIGAHSRSGWLPSRKAICSPSS